jgi:hypothetical protein
MKKYFICMVLCIWLVLITDQFAFAQSQKEFIDSQYGYSINHPSSWKASIYRSGIVVANINSPDNKSGLQIRILNSKKPIERFISDYIDDFKKSMKAVFLDQGKKTYGSYNGFWMSFRSDSGGKLYFLKSYVIPTGDSRIFVFQAGTPFEQRNSDELIMDLIASSFRLRR